MVRIRVELDRGQKRRRIYSMRPNLWHRMPEVARGRERWTGSQPARLKSGNQARPIGSRVGPSSTITDSSLAPRRDRDIVVYIDGLSSRERARERNRRTLTISDRDAVKRKKGREVESCKAGGDEEACQISSNATSELAWAGLLLFNSNPKIGTTSRCTSIGGFG